MDCLPKVTSLFLCGNTNLKTERKGYRQSPYPWATLTDGGPPFFPAAWPAQLCHQGSNSLLPRQVAHRLSKCLGPPLDIFTRPLWLWSDLWSEYSLGTQHICTHEFFDGRFITKSWLKLQFKNALLLRQEKFMELYGIFCILLQSDKFSFNKSKALF